MTSSVQATQNTYTVNNSDDNVCQLVTYGYCFAPESSVGPITVLTSKNGLGANVRDIAMVSY